MRKEREFLARPRIVGLYIRCSSEEYPLGILPISGGDTEMTIMGFQALDSSSDPTALAFYTQVNRE